MGVATNLSLGGTVTFETESGEEVLGAGSGEHFGCTKSPENASGGRKCRLVHSLTHSLDGLTGDGSLRPPDVAITGSVPGSICSEPDINLQLADPSMSGTTSWTFPFLDSIRRKPCVPQNPG